MAGKDVSPHDAAVLIAALDESQLPNAAVSLHKIEHFRDHTHRQLFALIGDLHNGREAARVEIWRVLEAMGWTLPGDNAGSFVSAIVRCRAAKARDEHIHQRLEYIGKLWFVHRHDTNAMLTEAWTVMEELGRPKFVSKPQEVVSRADQKAAQEALRVAAEKPGELPPEKASQEEINRRKLEELKARRAAREAANGNQKSIRQETKEPAS